MNLRDSLPGLTKSRFMVLSALSFLACDEPANFGLELELQESGLNTQKIELALPVSTIYIDSLRADIGGTVVLGHFEDNISGAATATPYLEYRALTDTLPGDSLTFVSADIVLEPYQARSLANTITIDLSVHEVADTLFGNPVYLTNRKLETETTVIGSLGNYSYSLDEKGAFKIPLTDEFAGLLFTRLKKASDPSFFTGFGTVAEQDSMVALHRDSLTKNLYNDRPIALVPGSASSGLLKFLLTDTLEASVSVTMSNAADTKSYSFDFKFRGNYHTYIKRDRSSSVHAGLVDEYVPSAGAKNGHIDLIAGLYPEIGIGPLFDFVDTIDNFLVNKAELSFVANDGAVNFIEDIRSVVPYIYKNGGRINGGGLAQNNLFESVILSNFGNVYRAGQTPLAMDLDSVKYSGDITLFADFAINQLRQENLRIAEKMALISTSLFDLARTSLDISRATLTIYYTVPNE